ncbi:MAG: metal ABC transporter substrate-binding protein [Geminicoccus sp.]|nr:metal ABC transporter substrate-binding protein [Geminicoccus sp.]
MFRRKFALLAASAFSSSVVATVPVHAQRLEVVTSFSILQDMVEQVAGDQATVSSLVGRNEDTHVFTPSPADARRLSSADLLIVNGLEFEGWMERLIDASGYEGAIIEATKGIDASGFEEGGGDHHDDHGDEDDHHDNHGDEDDHNDDHGDEDDHHNDHGDEDNHHDDHSDEDDHHDDHGDEDDHHDDHGDEDDHHNDHGDEDDHNDDHGDEDDHHDDHGDAHHGHHHGEYDPHAWQSLKLAAVYVENITEALSAESPTHEADFRARADTYIAELGQLDARLQSEFAAISENCRTVITSHDAFQYFGAEYGLQFAAPQGLSTASEASARDVAALIEQVRSGGIGGVFIENLADSRIIQQIASETGLSVGGTLFTGALSDVDGPAPTYAAMIAHNAEQLLQSLRAAEEKGAC